METYTLSSIASMLGLSRAVISRLVAEGFVAPTRGKRRELRFSFQDMVLLRTAYSLQAAQIPPRKILRSLQRLKATLPEELPLSGLRIAAVGNEVAVRDGDTQWVADSGQLLIDFEMKPVKGPGNVRVLNRAAAVAEGPTAQQCFELGLSLEEADPAAARAAYAQAIALAPDYVDPVLNLGVLLGEGGHPREAAALYKQALKHLPGEPLLHFNLAIAQEDLGQWAGALASYEDCLRLDPDLADAHFNAARLHERLGDEKRAIRHYSAYRRLQR